MYPNYPLNIDDLHDDEGYEELFEFYNDEAVKQAQQDYMESEADIYNIEDIEDIEDIEENIIIVNRGLRVPMDQLDAPSKWDKFRA
jgi:hypothetical protein